MSVIRDFVVGLPAACGVPEGLAEIFGEANGKLFDYELANPDGALNRKNFYSTWDRLSLAFLGWQRLADPFKYNFARELLIHASRSIEANGKGKPYQDSDMAVKALMSDQSNPNIAPVAALMTVDQASILSTWA